MWVKNTSSFLSQKDLFMVISASILLCIIIGILVFLLLRLIVFVGGLNESTYDIVLSTVAVLGVITIGGAAVIQYRKQLFIEAAAELDRDAKYSALLSTAIEHLGSESFAVCRGGLYELKRLAIDSKKDRESIIEIISSFIVENSRFRSGIDRETTTSRREERESVVDTAKEIICLLLRCYSDNCEHLNLCGISLQGMDLERACLWGANLVNANLSDTNLSHANLMNADLENADLECANMEKAFLDNADFSYANLSNAQLTDASIVCVDFEDADLSSACLEYSDLEEADFTNADIRGAGFAGAKVTAEQLLGARIDDTTLLSQEIRNELDELKKVRINI